MAKTQVFIDELGDDKLDGLTIETSVLTAARAKEVASNIENPTYSIYGSEPYVRRMKADLRID